MNTIENIKKTIANEATAVNNLSNQITKEFEDVINIIAKCKGKVILSGVGKSGLIGRKIAASFASTGTPAFFIHSTESLHGDLGMIEKEDIVILISNSGETNEVISMIPSLNKIGCQKIAITSKEASTLAKACDSALIYQYEKEVDHLGLAPTTSAMLTLAIGDALATTVSKMKDFKKEDFHVFHPGGSLGKQLSDNKNN